MLQTSSITVSKLTTLRMFHLTILRPAFCGAAAGGEAAFGWPASTPRSSPLYPWLELLARLQAFGKTR